jgi:sec-independent protein translocase protein TatC
MRKLLRSIWNIITFPFRVIFWIFRTIARWFSGLANEIRSLLSDDVEDESLPDTFAKVVENPMGLMEHVDALRRHLLRSVVFIAITTSLSFGITPWLIDELAKPIGGINALTAIEVTEGFGVYMRVALLVGFALGLPYVVFELWRFAAPGLHRSSRFTGLFAIPLVGMFFLAGMAFSYFFMLPTALEFLTGFLGINTQLRPSSYISFVTGLMFWIGVSFEFPLVIYVLAAMGVVKSRVLADQWRLASVVIAVVAAVITPTVDPASMALVMGPMILLYFLSIGLAAIAQRARARQASA